MESPGSEQPADKREAVRRGSGGSGGIQGIERSNHTLEQQPQLQMIGQGRAAGYSMQTGRGRADAVRDRGGVTMTVPPVLGRPGMRSAGRLGAMTMMHALGRGRASGHRGGASR